MLDSKSLPEIVYGSADSAIAKQISTLVKKGLLKKIAAKIYTSNLLEPAEVILKRNLFGVLGKLYPGAVLSFRSALEVWPSPGGIMYLSYTYTKNIELPEIIERKISTNIEETNEDIIHNIELYKTNRIKK